MGDVNSKEFVEAVRKRPAMYTGSTSIRGFNELFRKIINIFFDAARANHFSLILTEGHKGTLVFKNFQEKIFNDSALNFTRFKQTGLQGIEFVVLNALSKQFEFRAFADDGRELFAQSFEKGELKKGEINNLPYTAEKLEIDFELDDTIFSLSDPLNANFYHEEIRQIAFLHKGKILNIDYPVAGDRCHAVFMFENGLRDLIEIEKLKRLGGAYFETYFEKQFEDFSVEISFSFRKSSVDAPYLVSYVNNHFTHEDGTHVKSLLKGIAYGIKKYLQTNGQTEKVKISKKGIRENLIAAVHIKMNKPLFEGSTRNKLISAEIIEPLTEKIANVFFEKLVKQGASADEIIRKFNLIKK